MIKTDHSGGSFKFPTWDEVELDHLRMARRLSFRKKLLWLEQSAALAQKLISGKEIDRSLGVLDPTAATLRPIEKKGNMVGQVQESTNSFQHG